MMWRTKKTTQRFKEESQIISRYAIYWLLASLLLVIAPHLLRQPIWVITVCLGIIIWRYFKEQNHWALPAKPLRILFAMGLFISTYWQYHTLNGLDAGTTLLTIMLCLKLVELQNMRDALTALLLAYFLLLSGFLYDQSIFTGIYLFLVVLLLTASLLVLNHPHSKQKTPKKYYLKQASTLLIQALPLMLVLFVLVPRIPGPLWSLPNNNSAASTGLSSEMSMGDITQLADNHDPVFRVSFSDEAPSAEKLYWRGPVLWKTDGRNWVADNKSANKQTSPDNFIPMAEPISYQVTLQPQHNQWLFALDLPTTLPKNSRLSPDYQLLHKDKINDVYRYSVQSVLSYQNRQLNPSERLAALQLPTQRNSETLALGKQWQQLQLNNRELVEHALNYIRQQPFYYTRKPPALQGNDPVDQFLFDTRQGFCEHYAAAFVTLMRAMDIPARVVTGYQGGEYNELGNYLLVRQSDAHAWTEVWLESEGWLRIDPTSVIDPSRIEAYDDLQRFSSTQNDALFNPDTRWLIQAWLQSQRRWDAVNHLWNQWVLGFDDKKQQQLLQRFGIDNRDIGSIIKLMLGAIFSLLGLLALYLYYQQRKNNDPLQQAYQNLCLKLAKHNVDNANWIGPQQRCKQAMQSLPAQQQVIAALFEQYIQLRYAGNHGKADQRRFIQAVKRFRC